MDDEENEIALFNMRIYSEAETCFIYTPSQKVKELMYGKRPLPKGFEHDPDNYWE